MTVKLLPEYHLEFLSLKGGRTCSSEFTLVKIPHCSKSHVAAQLCIVDQYSVGLAEITQNVVLMHYCIR